MATVADRVSFKERRPDLLSGTPRAHAIDRWIFVAMAAWFIVVVLVGFIPDAIGKVAAVKAGTHPAFPPISSQHDGPANLCPLFPASIALERSQTTARVFISTVN